MNSEKNSPLTQEIQNKELTTKQPTSLEEMVANTCYCKLRKSCPDKTSSECMQHRNIYQEFMCNR
jgi:hypothetical protein